MEKYSLSQIQFSDWRRQTGKLIGFMLWRVEFAGFLLEAWNDNAGRMVIFQVFESGRGFKAYTHNADFVEQFALDLK